jgi:hypothetical protein
MFHANLRLKSGGRLRVENGGAGIDTGASALSRITSRLATEAPEPSAPSM